MSNYMRDFNFSMPVTVEKGDDGEWRIKGVASTEHMDLQGEIVRRAGLDITPLKDGRGVFNWNHEKGPENVIGVIDAADFNDDGLYVEGYLLKESDRAKSVKKLLDSFKSKHKRRLGMSVEGKVLRRTGPNQSVIAAACIDKVALTIDPVNPNTYTELVKSLIADDKQFEQENQVVNRQLLNDLSKNDEQAMEKQGYISYNKALELFKSRLEALVPRNWTKKQVLELMKERLEKADKGGGGPHKYIKRTGSPGNYKYWYKLPNGHVVSSDSPDGAPHVDHSKTFDDDERHSEQPKDQDEEAKPAKKNEANSGGGENDLVNQILGLVADSSGGKIDKEKLLAVAESDTKNEDGGIDYYETGEFPSANKLKPGDSFHDSKGSSIEIKSMDKDKITYSVNGAGVYTTNKTDIQNMIDETNPDIPHADHKDNRVEMDEKEMKRIEDHIRSALPENMVKDFDELLSTIDQMQKDNQKDVKKALAAGNYNTAPSSRGGGAALQTESMLTDDEEKDKKKKKKDDDEAEKSSPPAGIPVPVNDRNRKKKQALKEVTKKV